MYSQLTQPGVWLGFIAPVPIVQLAVELFGASTIVGPSAQISLASAVNKAVELIDDYNGVADYTGGDPANTLTVCVSYMIFNVSTGTFV